MSGSKLAVGGTERSQMNSFGSRSGDRRSSEVTLLVDSFWLVAVTLGRSTSEQSTVTGSPGETAFLLRKAARRYRSRRLVEGDLDFLVDFSDFSSSAGNGRHPFFSEQKLKEKSGPILRDILTTKPLDIDAEQISMHLVPSDWKSISIELVAISQGIGWRVQFVKHSGKAKSEV